ncbi:MAG: hypothetical protein QGH39_07445 [Candidatus Thermoplasmatota archaeon]|jgi:hypothetical protein|nr:hypothetical protein [Candidatus Thermoplasmatota archaeon]MDP7265380.1 hypothetical protein [Candidatus Thermoplasmatota archaeon]
MSNYTVPAIIAFPFLVAIILSILIPSKNSSKKRRAGYYSSSLVQVVYSFSGLFLLGGGIFAALFLMGSQRFSEVYYISNITLYSLVGIGLITQNFLSIRQSRKIAIRGVTLTDEVTFSKAGDDVIMEVVEVEAIEED